jgi:hypothetical protein
MEDNQNQNDSTSVRKPNISEVEVLSTATAQIEANGSTTTLDVKNKLRDDGYWAKQAEVSQLMQQLFVEGKLQSTNDLNRPYQTYTMPVAVVADEPKSFSQNILSFFGIGK